MVAIEYPIQSAIQSVIAIEYPKQAVAINITL
jgi:hypothetical protein